MRLACTAPGALKPSRDRERRSHHVKPMLFGEGLRGRGYAVAAGIAPDQKPHAELADVGQVNLAPSVVLRDLMSTVRQHQPFPPSSFPAGQRRNSQDSEASAMAFNSSSWSDSSMQPANASARSISSA